MSPKSAAWLAGLSTYGLLFAGACLVRPVHEVLQHAFLLTMLAVMVLVALLTVALAVLVLVDWFLLGALFLLKSLEVLVNTAVAMARYLEGAACQFSRRSVQPSPPPAL